MNTRSGSLPFALALIWVAWFGSSAGVSPAQAAGPALANPILFVTQVPIPADFTTIASVFGNHSGAIESAGRGGDLYIRYPDGTLKNLTRLAGFGEVGQQGLKAIAVREPCVDWNGTKAVFSMVVGAPEQQFQVRSFYWQLYEVSGLGQNETPVIVKVPNQPADYNNVSPIYGTDERIIFTSDRPRNGQRHLYPQLDEYEEAATNTGLWSLNPATGDLFLMNHLPSGAFSPSLDSFGRVIFTRWDHLQRDQQADADAGAMTYGTFNYADESAGAARFFNTRDEVFPEPRSQRTDLLVGTNLEGNNFNIFGPWQINEDGTEEETLNHIGRHELQGYFNRSLNDNPNLTEFNAGALGRFNANEIFNFIQVREDPRNPGLYYGVDTPEFATHASGQIVNLTGAANLNGDVMQVRYITHRETESYTETPSPNHSGHYRNPLPLSDGTLVAAHTVETYSDANIGTRESPKSRYAFRLKTLKKAGDVWVADQPLTAGISNSLSYFDPDELVSYSGEMWELDPAEVRPRAKPGRRAPVLEAPERQVLAEEGVDLAALRSYLVQNQLALLVSRNVTTRDHADRQQPYNLRVAGTATQSLGDAGKIYDVSFLQFYQGDQIRGLGWTSEAETPREGRRVLAQTMHDPAVRNPPVAGAPDGGVRIAADGSMAAFVPARRAMSWQMTAPSGEPVVRERYWLTFQPGEMRTCTSCHGLNTRDQAERPTPQNKPEALRALMRHWKTLPGNGNALRIYAQERLPDGRFQVHVTGVPERSYILQFSVQLPQWLPLATNVADNGLVHFIDAEAPLSSRRFYRIMEK